jgi:RNA polymerase sigma-70 factor (ECF subfamily)
MAPTLTSYTPSGWVEQFAPRPRNMQTSTIAPSHPIEDIDSACLRALTAGDRAAFAQIVDRWQTRLINFFYRATGNRADAEDLAQETFIELNRAAARYKAQGTFNAFIFTLARRRLIDGYRKKSRRPLEYVDPGEYFMQSQPEESDHIREIEEAFHRALTALPDNQRNAILMLQQQGLSYVEIAQALDASVSAVKTWIHRARTHLREELKDFA